MIFNITIAPSCKNNNPYNLTTPKKDMEETATLNDLLKELREIKRRIERIEEAVEELMDSTLTSEEEELLREVKEKVEKRDFSDFVPLEKLDDVLRE